MVAQIYNPLIIWTDNDNVHLRVIALQQSREKKILISIQVTHKVIMCIQQFTYILRTRLIKVLKKVDKRMFLDNMCWVKFI